MTPYVYLDAVSRACLYTHHQYIAGFFLVGAFSHGAIFLLRDDFWLHPSKDIARSFSLSSWLLKHRQGVISHLSYISLFLGFHTLGLYVHNDVMQASSNAERQISLVPVFAQWIQMSHGNSLGFGVTGGDVLVHHGIALGFHVTTLILIKAALNSRSSKLMPDKLSFGYGFPCDGPGRGGT